MPSPGVFGGPGLPGKVRVGKGTLVSEAVMEQDNFGRFIKQAERKGDDLMALLANDMEERARAYAPVRTGRLKRSIKGVVLNGGREARLSSDVPYATIMEEGSKAHLIHGVRANFRWKHGSRKFVWNNPKFGPVDDLSDDEIEHSLGQRHGYVNWSEQYGATVRHPGTKPKKFFYRAWRATWDDARKIMTRVYRD